MKSVWKKLAAGVAAILLTVAVLAVGATPAAAEPGFLGMQVQGMSPEIAQSLSLKSADGVLVRDIALGGAADISGFKRGDLILKFGGKKIDSFATMVKVAQTTRPGQKVKVDILRQGKPKTLTLTLGGWTESWSITKSAVASLPASGLTLSSLTKKLRKGFGLRWGSVGVVVTLVDPDRRDISLRRGDLILQVNQNEVWRPDQVVAAYKAAKQAGRKKLLLLVERVNGFWFMQLPVK